MENDRVIRILVADRQEIFRDSVKRLLESEPGFTVMGGAGDAPQALQLVQELNPDVLLLDLALRNGDSLEILRTLAANRHRVRTIGLVDGTQKSVPKAALRHGARGAIRRDSATQVLFESIRTVFRDEHWIFNDASRAPVDAAGDAASPRDVAAPANRFNLTRREMDIVSVVAAGKSNKSIARKLSLSEDTVKHHVSHAFDKLGVFSRLELAVFAFNNDLVRDIADLVGCAGRRPARRANSAVNTHPPNPIGTRPNMEKLSVIRIVIAHHEQFFREGLTLLLGSEPGFVVVGDAPDGDGAVRMVRDLRPDVLLVDMALPEGGINVLKKLAVMPERVRAIAMTASADEDMLIAALEQGARGLIVKESPTALLFKSIRTVLADQVWIGRESVGLIVERMRRLAQQHEADKHAKKFRLTRREMEIVMAVAGGDTNKDIARRLSVREDTVKHHVSNVFNKLGVSSRLELAMFAINHELVRDIDLASSSHRAATEGGQIPP